jgi:hypothetical protein
MNQFITVPETTLPSGLVIPSFNYGKYLCSKGADGKVAVTAEGAPWVNINFAEAKAACEESGFRLVTEIQELAIRHNAAQQDGNWTKGKVGEGKLFRGLRKGNVSSAQTGTYQSPDAKERRILTLSNGEQVVDLNGNAFTWVFDDVQGTADGLTGKIAADSISLTTAPYPSLEKGMGWRPSGEANWSGAALVRGGCWSSGSSAGVFYLDLVYPGGRNVGVGFRCTKGL